MTLVEKCDLIPPWACRLVAKIRDASGRQRMMTERELMKKTGWGKKHLRRVYKAASFEHVTAGDIDKFLAACGITWSNRKRQRSQLKRAWKRGMPGLRAIRHLRCTTGWQGNQLRLHFKRIELLLGNATTGK